MSDPGQLHPEDERLARDIGGRYGERILAERQRFASTASLNQNRFAQTLIFDLLDDLRKEQWPASAGALDEVTVIDLVAELDTLVRLIQFYAIVGLDGAVALKLQGNRFGLPALFDIFNRRARRKLLRPSRDPSATAVSSDDLGRWLRDVLGANDHLSVVPARDAVRDYMVLFVDNLRVTQSTSASSGSSYVGYTVHSKNGGYQLEYYPQYRYSPTVFGSSLTSPVHSTILSGHYRFQGWHQGTLHEDTGVYLAGQNITSAHLRGF